MTEADVDEVSTLTARVFAGGSDDKRALIALAYRACPFMRIDHGLVAVREDKIVGKWQALDLRVRVARTPVRAAGLHAVLVDPAVDGEGLAWSMVSQGIASLFELGHDLALGFVQKGAAYESIGARTVAADYEWAVDAWRTPKPDAEPALAFRDAEASDVAAIVGFSERAQVARTGSLVRTEETWPWIERRPPIVWLAESGYLGLRNDDTSVEVREAAGASPAFYRSALAALGAYAVSRGVRIVRGHLPPDHPLVRASLDFGARVVTEYPRRGGMMAAVLDVQSFLPKLRGALEARLAASSFRDRNVTLSITSRLMGETRAELLLRGERGASRPEVDLRVTTTGGALAQMVFGFRTLASAVTSGGASHTDISSAALGSEETEALAEALFPLGTPFLQHTDRW